MPHFTNDSPYKPGIGALQDLPVLEGRDPADQDTITSKELAALTGATYRQIDYWCSQGHIHPVEDDRPGSGAHRRFDPSLVDKVKLIVKISKAFNRDNSPLGYLVEHYEDGEFDMGDGVYLTWDTVEIEREAN
jgi:hypothetical protein